MKSGSKKGTWWQALSSLTVSVLLILSLRWLLIEPYLIPSGSMQPTLLVNDYILVNKLAYGLRLPFSSTWLWRHSSPQRGEVVVFRSVEGGGLFMIKRVVGLPGDLVELDEQGRLIINGQVQLRERAEPKEGLSFSLKRLDPYGDFQLFEERLGGQSFHSFSHRKFTEDVNRSWQVPEGHLFLLGDHRDRSSDSRFWGYLPQENLLGRASFIWFSCEREEVSHAPSCPPTQIRMPRLFQSVHSQQ